MHVHVAVRRYAFRDERYLLPPILSMTSIQPLPPPGWCQQLEQEWRHLARREVGVHTITRHAMDAKPVAALFFEIGVEFFELEAWAFGGSCGGVSGRELGGEGQPLDGVVGTAEVLIGVSDEFKQRAGEVNTIT